jgi:SlyX protein
MNDQARFETLEIRLAHLEHALNELSDVVARQQRELDSSREHAQRLAERLAASLTAQDPATPGDEKPPHY